MKKKLISLLQRKRHIVALSTILMTFVVMSCLFIDSVDITQMIDGKAVNYAKAGTTATFKMHGHIKVEGDPRNDKRLVFGFLAPKSWNLAQNARVSYTEDTFEDINVDKLFKSAITGKVDNNTIIKGIVNIAGKEVLNCITVLGSIIVIIIIHSIIKSIGDSLENKSVAQITYYVQYIMIVTLIMSNFSEILQMIKGSIQSLVGFMNSLVPLLITLMLATGNFASAGILEPIILFIITFIGNFITAILLPFVLISTALAIVSKISNKIQIDKLSKFFNSSVVWILGVVLTLFVGIISIEGSLSSTVDRNNGENDKSCSF